jgi:hypothetical protein
MEVGYSSTHSQPRRWMKMGLGCVACIATPYELDDPETESYWGGGGGFSDPDQVNVCTT